MVNPSHVVPAVREARTTRERTTRVRGGAFTYARVAVRGECYGGHAEASGIIQESAWPPEISDDVLGWATVVPIQWSSGGWARAMRAF